MQATPPYDDILEDETLAPLKRNHACLQCKKRKVKCDAVRPTCNPCMRSHAHALRSAHRNKSRPPPLVCSYTEDDDDSGAGGSGLADIEAERKRVSSASMSAKRAVVGNGGGPDRKAAREKELRATEERETLKARIAELEARIAGLTTSSNNKSVSNTSSRSNTSDWNPPMVTTKTFKHTPFPTPPISTQSLPTFQPQLLSIDSGTTSFDFSELLMVPSNWPRNLPSPPLLEHLIETFFQCEPQTPRMFHRPTLLTRIKLPPTHNDFPFPALLHAICATAAPHTAWTVTVPPDQVEISRFRHVAMGLDLETAEDFATAQCEAAERCIRHGTMTQMIGSGQYVFDLVRAQLLLSYCYLAGGMALRAWMTSGIPCRLIKALEINNKNHRNSIKPALLSDPTTDSEREERLATIWISYLTESGFSLNSCWGQNFTLSDIAINLPTSTDEFQHRFDSSGSMKANPQSAHDHDVLFNHPMPDPFILGIKASFLMGRASQWLMAWNQRDIKPNDEMDGVTWPNFINLHQEITTFQSSIPVALRNIYRLVDTGDMTAFDANLLSVHIYPNVALAMLHEPFVEWDKPEDSESLRVIQRAFEAVVGVLHLIPSQLDVSVLLTPILCFSLFTIGRFVLQFIVRAQKQEQFSQAMRWRTDYQAIVTLFQRYGTKHVVGTHLIQFLTNHQYMYEEGKVPDSMTNACRTKTLTGQQQSSTPNLESSTTPDFEFISSLGSSDPSQSGTSGTSPCIQSLGQTPESDEAQRRNTPPVAPVPPRTFDPLEFLNPMDATAVDQVAAMIETGEKNVSEQFVNDMLMAEALGAGGFGQAGFVPNADGNGYTWS